jgi:hypothetical protein
MEIPVGSNSPHIVVIQPQILYVHIHLSKASFIKVQQLRVRNFQPYLEVRREFVLKDIDNVTKRFHLLARHNDSIGKHLMR